MLKFSDFLCHITLEPLDGKTSFQSHIVEQHKSYRMVVEAWESIQRTKMYPERLQTACTKPFTVELMDVSRLWDLNEKKVEELLHLLVFVWSPRSERWPR